MSLFFLVSLMSIYLYGVVGVYASAFMLIGLFAVIAAFDRNIVDVLIALSASVLLTLLSDPITVTIETALNVPTNAAFDVIYMISLSILTVSGSLVLRALKRRFRWDEKVDVRLKKIVAGFGVATVIVYYLCIYLSAYIGETIELIQLNLFFFGVYLVISLVSLYIYAKSLRKSYEVRRRESEFRLMQRYTEELEQQYTEIRKFRHDHQNILSSLDAFVQEDDFAGLKRYYEEQLKRTSEHLESNNFKLENLGRVFKPANVHLLPPFRTAPDSYLKRVRFRQRSVTFP
ncbi:hypothetical protein [Saccharibacillus sacchari]|uniref:hypothetical protein n=1 Tax=Saccharibacillus sacchari TaxID=456493 RepID=UPI0012EBE08C|nr:hypothetical protein [Saccharibacillus sacchari]